MKNQKGKCQHKYRQIVYSGVNAKSHKDYDMSPPRYWYEFYCIKCLYLSAIQKRNRLEMTD